MLKRLALAAAILAAAWLIWRSLRRETAALPPPAAAPSLRVPETASAPETTPATSTADTVVGYCMRCRAQRPIAGAVIEMAGGRRVARGTCTVCGAGMSRFLKSEVPSS